MRVFAFVACSQTLLIAAAVTLAAPGNGTPADNLPVPKLPAKPYEYADVTLPAHFQVPYPRFGNVLESDNTPANNPITNEGATLGRVLFYDVRLSANDTTSCGSCHQQRHGFSDPERLSKGLHGKRTARRSMGLTNARFYAPGRFFWDERAATLEQQVLMPIQDPVEMGMNLDDLEEKLRKVDFYPPLFEAAFGSPEINRERISRALAQFVRSLVSGDSKFDRFLSTNNLNGFNFVNGNAQNSLTQQELLGLQLFSGIPVAGFGRSARCSRCHGTTAQISRAAQNNGLDLRTDNDQGAGGGRFKAPSLRNVAVRAPYMHDGRFKSLREVIEHYSAGIQNHPNLDRTLSGRRGRRGRGRGRGGRGQNQQGEPERLNLSQNEINALVAFLETLTDENFLKDPRFSDPFNKAGTAAPGSKQTIAKNAAAEDPDRAANLEKIAAGKLELARGAISSRVRKAKLQLLVKRFGETKAGQTARELLDQPQTKADEKAKKNED